MSLAIVRSIGMPRRLRTPQEFEDFEQELIDQYALALAAGGVTDGWVSAERRSCSSSSSSSAVRYGLPDRRTPTGS